VNVTRLDESNVWQAEGSAGPISRQRTAGFKLNAIALARAWGVCRIAVTDTRIRAVLNERICHRFCGHEETLRNKIENGG
jgi:hypothetical protein